MTSWLPRILDRIERALADLEETVVEILTDLAGRNEGFKSHDKTLGVLIRHVEDHNRRLTAIEQRLSRSEGRQEQADMDQTSMPWWRDWWAVCLMLLTVIPVTLAFSLALGLLTPEQVSQAAQAAVNGALSAVGISD